MSKLKALAQRFWTWLTHPGKHQVRVPTIAATADAVLMVLVVFIAMQGHPILGAVLLAWAALKIIVPVLAADPERVKLGLA